MKNEHFQQNKNVYFLIGAQNVECGYMLEPPRQDGFSEHPHCTCVFWIKNMRNVIIPQYGPMCNNGVFILRFAFLV